MKERIQPDEIKVGLPLAFHVVADDGRLLLSRGQVVTSENAAIQLVETAFKVRPSKSEHLVSVFERIEGITARLAVIEDDVVYTRRLEGWLGRITSLTQTVIDTADQDPDAAFAAVHLEIRYPYDVIHHLMAALIASRMALAAKMSPKERFSIVAAALTHDIAVLSMRPEIEAVDTLTEAQSRRIRKHTVDGVKILKDLGVEDELWLRCVREHHEYLDGSGYLGLSADQITLPSRMMSLADTFSAMLRPRPYRDRLLAKKILEELYADPAGRYDKALLILLIQSLGIFPPGSVVRLASNEIAVAVRSRPGEIRTPLAAALSDSLERPLYKPTPRNTADEATAILTLLPPERVGKVRRLLSACWSRP